LGQVSLPVLVAGNDIGPMSNWTEGKLPKALYGVTPFVVSEEPRAKEFAARFKEAFGTPADVHAALAYEDLKILYDAICRGKDVKRIGDELAQVKEFAGLAGPLTFTKERQLLRPAFVVRFEGAAVKTVKRYDPDRN
jgi:ABC-type branched-subunit amino acid transport system substrate-binding protein